MTVLGKTAEGGRYLRPFAKILLALAAIRQPPPNCPECGSHRTQIVGLADDS